MIPRLVAHGAGHFADRLLALRYRIKIAQGRPPHRRITARHDREQGFLILISFSPLAA
jgi:hypothetical protein